MRQALALLAEAGLVGSAPERLGQVVSWCGEECVATGDGRYCVLGDVFRDIDQWWREHDSAGGVPRAVIENLNRLLVTMLPEVLAAPDSPEGTRLARRLQDDVGAHLNGPAGWIAAGYAQD